MEYEAGDVMRWLRNKCYWFVDGKEIEEYYRRLQNGETIIIKAFSGKTKDLATSGSSSGTPKFTTINKEQLELRMAAELYTMSWTGWKIGDRWCHLWYPVVREHKDSFIRKIKRKIANKLDNRLFLNYFNLDDQIMERYYRRIMKFNPKLLVGYSEAIHIFAQFILKNHPKSVFIPNTISSGGPLFPEWRKNIEEAFSTRVWNRWGCSEFGVISQEDWRKNGEMKIITQRGLSVREKNGELLITDKNNIATEFIDYDLSDKGKVEGDIITELEGKLKSNLSYLRIYRG